MFLGSVFLTFEQTTSTFHTKLGAHTERVFRNNRFVLSLLSEFVQIIEKFTLSILLLFNEI